MNDTAAAACDITASGLNAPVPGSVDARPEVEGETESRLAFTPAAIELMKLWQAWHSASHDERVAIWHKMLFIHADQQFSIGIVNNVMQPVVVNNALKNVPEKGLYNWDPGAFLGIYRPDTFWFTEARRD